MIHILTQHFGTDAWFEIQKRHIEKYSPDKSEYRVYVVVYRTKMPQDFVLPENYEVIDLGDRTDIVNEHYLIIESCYDNFVKERVADDDIVIYMDSDAFPIDNWTGKIKNYLEENHICAVYRYEDRGVLQPDEYYPYPHLCFYSFKKKDRETYGFRHELPPGFPCPGFTINDVVRNKNLRVKELVRTNKFNNHPTMFGVYDDIIYHQSSGSRTIVGRPYSTAGAGPDHNPMCYEGIDCYHRHYVIENVTNFLENEVNPINVEIWFVIYNKISTDYDCNWIRRFYIGKI